MEPSATTGEGEDILDQIFYPENMKGRGLLEFQDPFPLALLHLQLPINNLKVLGETDGIVEVNFNWANNFADEKKFVVDAETYQLSLTSWYAVRNNFYLGASISAIARNGGILDPVIDGFHDTFGLSDAGRSERRRNDYEIMIQDKEGRKRSLSSGLGIGDLVLKAHWNLYEGNEWVPAVFVDGLMSLPISTHEFGSNGVDFGLGVSVSKTFYKFVHLYGVAGATYLTKPEVEGIDFEEFTYQAAGGAEVAILDDLSLIFQVMRYSPLLKFPSPLDEERNYLAGGLKWEFLTDSELEFSFVENFAPFENTADVFLSLGFRFRL